MEISFEVQIMSWFYLQSAKNVEVTGNDLYSLHVSKCRLIEEMDLLTNSLLAVVKVGP